MIKDGDLYGPSNSPPMLAKTQASIEKALGLISKVHSSIGPAASSLFSSIHKKNNEEAGRSGASPYTHKKYANPRLPDWPIKPVYTNLACSRRLIRTTRIKGYTVWELFSLLVGLDISNPTGKTQTLKYISCAGGSASIRVFIREDPLLQIGRNPEKRA